MMDECILKSFEELGKGVCVDVIANFIIRNPDAEDWIAVKMASLLSSPRSGDKPTFDTAAPVAHSSVQPDQSNPASIIPSLMNLDLEGISDESYKMIFVVNMEFGMGRGKLCSQVAHAALGLYLKIQKKGKEIDQLRIQQWLAMGEKKIVVKANNLTEMLKIQSQAEFAGLPYKLIRDAGCTQIPSGSATVLSVFGMEMQLDGITGSLKLL